MGKVPLITVLSTLYKCHMMSKYDPNAILYAYWHISCSKIWWAPPVHSYNCISTLLLKTLSIIQLDWQLEFFPLSYPSHFFHKHARIFISLIRISVFFPSVFQHFFSRFFSIWYSAQQVDYKRQRYLRSLFGSWWHRKTNPTIGFQKRLRNIELNIVGLRWN